MNKRKLHKQIVFSLKGSSIPTVEYHDVASVQIMPYQVNVWKVLKLHTQLPHKQALSGAGVQ